MHFGNPFEEEGSYLIHLTTKFVLGDNVAKSTRDAETIGHKQSSQIVTDRLIECTNSLYDVIHQKQATFVSTTECCKNKASKDVKLLKDDRRLFSNLYVACQSRTVDLDNFCDTQIKKKVNNWHRMFRGFDVVFDVYKKTTLRQDTRDGRG